MPAHRLLTVLLLAQLQPATLGNLDGQITAEEKSGAEALKMSRGGTAYLKRDGDVLYVGVEALAGGFAHVCVGNEQRVRVLHASAALGDAAFEAREGVWTRLTNFEWVLRDSTRVPAPTAEQKQAHLDTRGWLGTAKNGLTLVREFALRLQPDDRYLAVAFIEVGDATRISAGPSALSDACASVPGVIGPLPESAMFTPARWFPLARLGR